MLGRHVGYDGERRKNRRIWVCNPNERATARDGADGGKRCSVRAEQGQAGCRSVGSVIFFPLQVAYKRASTIFLPNTL